MIIGLLIYCGSFETFEPIILYIIILVLPCPSQNCYFKGKGKPQNCNANLTGASVSLDYLEMAEVKDFNYYKHFDLKYNGT
jgi:hypothetical protein